ncbi:hypothetical protein L1887_48033 [Cichorium endivia]|nr:hypothetical protein L1887_48033 [Cichorium endivia]
MHTPRVLFDRAAIVKETDEDAVRRHSELIAAGIRSSQASAARVSSATKDADQVVKITAFDSTRNYAMATGDYRAR